jgi:putative Ca2+/H+ antiporter (TMEM165/GDT1 family)
VSPLVSEAVLAGIDLGVLVATFAVIFPAELPDKSFLATVVLATRFPRLWVWLGAAAAFGVQMAVSVLAGQVLGLLPQRVVLAVTAVLFAVGAVILARESLRARGAQEEAEAEEAVVVDEAARGRARGAATAFGTAFAVIFTAEWGDLTQLVTAGQAARTGEPVSVFLGAWLALAAVSGLGVLLGGWLQQRVALWRLGAIAAVLLAVLALATVVQLVRA